MKAIVHTVKRDASAVRRVGYLANKKELVGDWIGREVLFNAESLLLDHHGKGRKTRHFVISLERDCDIATERLAEVAERFMATFAPASAWLGAVDRNTRAVHLHLVVCNSDGERTLNFSPSVLSKMQEMETWTGGILETGKRGAVLAKLTTAAQIKSMTYEQIHDAIERGIITVGRRNRKSEIVTSIIFNGRRVRLSTVQRVASLGDAENRDAANASVGVVVGMDSRRRLRADETRRGVGPGASQRPMGAAHAVGQTQRAAPHPPQRRESSGLFPAAPRPIQREGEPPRTFGLDSIPPMGGRVL